MRYFLFFLLLSFATALRAQSPLPDSLIRSSKVKTMHAHYDDFMVHRHPSEGGSYVSKISQEKIDSTWEFNASGQCIRLQVVADNGFKIKSYDEHITYSNNQVARREIVSEEKYEYYDSDSGRNVNEHEIVNETFVMQGNYSIYRMKRSTLRDPRVEYRYDSSLYDEQQRPLKIYSCNQYGDYTLTVFEYAGQHLVKGTQAEAYRSYPGREICTSVYSYFPNGEMHRDDTCIKITPQGVSPFDPKSYSSYNGGTGWEHNMDPVVATDYVLVEETRNRRFDRAGNLLFDSHYQEMSHMLDEDKYEYDDSGRLVRRTGYRGDPPGGNIYGEPCRDTTWAFYKSGYSVIVWKDCCNGFVSIDRDSSVTEKKRFGYEEDSYTRTFFVDSDEEKPSRFSRAFLSGRRRYDKNHCPLLEETFDKNKLETRTVYSYTYW